MTGAAREARMLAAEAKVRELETENAHLRRFGALAEAKMTELFADKIDAAYNCGIERDGKWMDAGISDAEWLQDELGLEPGWHDIADMKARMRVLHYELVRKVYPTKGWREYGPTLMETVEAIRAVPGSTWNELEDPVRTMLEDRHGVDAALAEGEEP
jgi:hypothetical protein